MNELQQMESRQTGPITSSFIWFEGPERTGSVGESTARDESEASKQASGFGKKSVVCCGVVTEVGELP